MKVGADTLNVREVVSLSPHSLMAEREKRSDVGHTKITSNVVISDWDLIENSGAATLH